MPGSGRTLSNETLEVVNYPVSSWTKVTANTELVNQLHLLYFSWEHGVCSLFSKYHFIEDRDSGTPRYCSSLLVNAVAALGCKFANRVEIQETFDGGEKFYLEAKRLWEATQDETSITDIQATALMSLWEASKGHHRKGAFYSRQALSMAIEGSFHTDEGHDAASREVRSATFWGIFTLDQIWSLYSGCLPHLSRRGTFDIPSIVMDGQDKLDWVPFFDDGTRLKTRTTQTSNSRSIFRGTCELSHVIYESLYTLYTPSRPVIIEDVMGVYQQYLEWYESMLPVLKSGENSTPMAIFNHLLYHFGILLLFSPLIGLRIESNPVAPGEMCTEAADSISALVRSYRELYGLQRIHTFIPYISLVSSVTYLTIINT